MNSLIRVSIIIMTPPAAKETQYSTPFRLWLINRVGTWMAIVRGLDMCRFNHLQTEGLVPLIYFLMAAILTTRGHTIGKKNLDDHCLSAE